MGQRFLLQPMSPTVIPRASRLTKAEGAETTMRDPSARKPPAIIRHGYAQKSLIAMRIFSINSLSREGYRAFVVRRFRHRLLEREPPVNSLLFFIPERLSYLRSFICFGLLFAVSHLLKIVGDLVMIAGVTA